MKIILSGGGTLGSVTPLLAIAEIIKEASPDAEFLWVGTRRGPEAAVVGQYHMRFIALASGKFRRYLSWWNVVDLGRIVIGLVQSLTLLWRENPDLCVSAGGFISVPLHAAAWLFGVKSWIHQQDLRVGLANRLMAPLAGQITTALEASVVHFKKKKTAWLGNPVRRSIFGGDRTRAYSRFHLDGRLPVIFALGGGTGSERVNQLIAEAIPHVGGICQIIHLSGKDRPQEQVARAANLFPYYHVYQFFHEEMADAYAAADLVISRGGFGTLTELGALGKPAIVLPKGGHQEENVGFLAKQGGLMQADERGLTGYALAQHIKQLLAQASIRLAMGQKLQQLLPTADAGAVLGIARKLTRRR